MTIELTNQKAPIKNNATEAKVILLLSALYTLYSSIQLPRSNNNKNGPDFIPGRGLVKNSIDLKDPSHPLYNSDTTPQQRPLHSCNPNS